MNPHEARSVAEFLIADFENEMQTTQRVLAAVPADRLDYQPDAKAKTGLGLVRHITLEDEWMLSNSLALTPGTRLGPYEIVSAIGRGGMGEVWRARDTKLGRLVPTD